MLAMTDRTLSRISSAVAVQLMGLQSLFQVVMNASMAWGKSFVESNEPRRMTFRVMMPLKISIWFIQDALVGVKWNTTWPFCLSSHVVRYMRRGVVQHHMDLLAWVGGNHLLH